MIKASVFAECALLPKWDKYHYDQLDCQGFVEAVLKEIGIRKPNGSPYNWRGSNSMFRTYFSWRGSVEECVKKFGEIPVGAFVYIWDPTGETEVGYSDGLGNAKHVGIYCGPNTVRDSTRSTKTKRDGVGTRGIAGFNMVTLFSGLDYELSTDYNDPVDNLLITINSMRTELKRMEDLIYEKFRDT